MKAQIKFTKDGVISKIDDRIYSSFIEHLGRAVYGGIYEPGHETADDMGFRQDVMDLIKELKVPMIRYPGGNFVSGYNWEDGTGDRSKRPRKMELAWNSIETNEVGIDEFQEWAKRASSDIMMAVNLGTRGADDARNVVEYCNSKTDTYYANMRRENGFEEPFGIKLWCLGNEMDGDWQIGTKRAGEYARLACETAKLMKMVDPSIELVACGSSGPQMETFGEWEETVLREAYDHVDYLSLHSYYGNPENNSQEYMGSAVIMDKFIKDVVAICDKVKEEKKSDKKIMLSFDEWNVWFHSNEQDKKQEPWQVAPPLLEDMYNLEDAIVVGDLMIALLKNSDRVKVACLAQLVNVIAPIMTVTGGGVWKQTIFYPFKYTSLNGRGTAIKADITCDTFTEGKAVDVPTVDAVAVISDDESEISVFAVNRKLGEDAETELSLDGFEGFELVEHISMEGDDLKAGNSITEPDKVVPVEKSIGGSVILTGGSWNYLKFKKQA
ncbi:MAG: alpha-N-arabinofuranosidase [Eubacterium sp.]|nr:alpha-N-arabinofuranosidase [Eubacterium sp.]